MDAVWLKKLLPVLIAVIFLLLACQLPFSVPQPTGTPSQVAPPVITPTPTVSALTVCLGEEPNTLYPFGGPNQAALSVLAAIDDGPIDTLSYNYQPVILQKLPSLADGDAQIVPVSVKAGSKIVDAAGNLTALATGTQVRPASCRTDGCVITYDGVTPLQMDQMTVTFKLRADITWSDGSPLTADDSVYAYQLAADKNTPGFQIPDRPDANLRSSRPGDRAMVGDPRLFRSVFHDQFLDAGAQKCMESIHGCRTAANRCGWRVRRWAGGPI